MDRKALTRATTNPKLKDIYGMITDERAAWVCPQEEQIYLGIVSTLSETVVLEGLYVTRCLLYEVKGDKACFAWQEGQIRVVESLLSMS